MACNPWKEKTIAQKWAEQTAATKAIVPIHRERTFMNELSYTLHITKCMFFFTEVGPLPGNHQLKARHYPKKILL